MRIQSFQNQLDFNQSSNRNKSLSDDSDLKGENNMNINYNGNYSLYLNTRPLQRETSVNFKFRAIDIKLTTQHLADKFGITNTMNGRQESTLKTYTGGM